MTTTSSTEIDTIDQRDRLLLEVQDRVLWLSMQMIDHANKKKTLNSQLSGTTCTVVLHDLDRAPTCSLQCRGMPQGAVF